MVRLVQCLCGPERHCLIGIAYEPGITAAQKDFGSSDDITLTEANAAEYVRTMAVGLRQRGSLQPWCELCGSRAWIYEDMPTRFKTMAEALPEIRRVEEENARSRAMILEARENADLN